MIVDYQDREAFVAHTPPVFCTGEVVRSLGQSNIRIRSSKSRSRPEPLIWVRKRGPMLENVLLCVIVRRAV